MSCFALYGQTWTGTSSSDWNTASNWSPASVPGAGNNAVVGNAGAPHQPVLISNITVQDITITEGTLDLAGFQITVTRNYRSTGGNVNNGTVAAVNFNQLENTTFNGAITLTKTGGTGNTSNGGNIFNGPTVIRNDNTNQWRLASTTGDTFNTTVQFIKGSTGNLQLAYSGTNVFNGQITIDNLAANNTLSFGIGGGTSVLNVGALVNGSFSIGNLDIRNFTQLQNVPNGSFGVDTFTSTNSSFQGDFEVEASDLINFIGSNTFARNATFLSSRLTSDGGNFFATTSGVATFTKTGPLANYWPGGNTFGTLVFTNNSNGLIQLARVNGDTYLSTSTFSNNGTNFIDISFNGANTFASTITINNTNPAGTIGFGRGGGTTVLSTGALVTTDFSVGNTLTINNFTQASNVPNGSFGVVTFNSSNSSFQGDFQVTATNSANFQGSNTFARNAIFSAPSLTANGGNSFAVLGGVARLSKTGAINNDWTGGNTFGTLEVTNAGTQRLRLAFSAGDTFLSTSSFTNSGPSFIDIALNGSNTFAETITINNTNPAGIIGFGRGTGTSVLATGALVTTDFSVGNTLAINDFTQVENVPNGSFGVATFNTSNSSFQGDFQVTATNSANFQGSNTFARNATFAAPSLTANGGNSFATLGGTARLTKTGGTNNDWAGGNTFGILEVTNSGTARLRFALSAGDTYLSTSSFTNSGPSFIDIALNGSNTFAETITIDNTNPAGIIGFGRGTGTSVLATGALVTADFNVGNSLAINNFTQVEDVPNGSFGVATFISTNSSFQGDFEVLATTLVNFVGSNTFARNATFTAPSLTANGGNSFAALGGIVSFFKTGAVNNDWAGGNTFGELSVRNSGTGRLRLANLNPENYLENVLFIRNGTGELDPARSGTNAFTGNISTVGSTNPVVFGGNGGTVSIVGNITQQIQGDLATPPVINRLEMNTSDVLELTVPLTIANTATFNNGIINSTPGNLLTFGNSATATGMTDVSYVNGPVRKLGNQAFTYPTGDSGFYAPIAMAARGGGGTDDYTAQYFQISPVNIPTDTVSKDPTIGLMNQAEYWDLERTTGTVARGLTLSYGASRTSPIIDHTELVSIRYDGSSWRDIGGIVSGNAGSGTITAGSTSPQRLYSIGSSFKILPIELLSFTAKPTEAQEIQIEWITATEENNSHFILEKSLDGKDWKTLTMVPGSGDSREEIAYEVLDDNPSLGRQYYRLIQVDFDGKSKIFQTIGVSLLVENSLDLDVNVFPNPSKGKIYLKSRNFSLDDVYMEIVDLTGKPVIQTSDLKNTKGVFDLSSLPKGLYILKLYSTKEVWTKKVILE